MHHVPADAFESNPPAPLRYLVPIAAWFVVAALAAALGAVTPDRPYLPGPAIALGVVTLVIAYRRNDGFRSFARSVDLRWVLLLHAVRAPVGVAFLYMMGRGALSPEFAVPAGWGDIASGLGALSLIPLVSSWTDSRRRWARAWNVLGLLDILFVVGSAQRVLLLQGDLDGLRGLLTFPGPLLPLFLVPLVIATHVLLLGRLRDGGHAS